MRSLTAAALQEPRAWCGLVSPTLTFTKAGEPACATILFKTGVRLNASPCPKGPAENCYTLKAKSRNVSKDKLASISSTLGKNIMHY